MPLAADAGVEGSRAPAGQPDAARWDACLALRFERVGPRSVLAQREHRGPLVVQKALYPEGPGVCQCVIVHPPAGIVGGDRILLTATVNAGAHAQLTTPGAARWYRSAGSQAEQTLRAQVEAYNAAHPAPADGTKKVIFYAGQTVLGLDDEQGSDE